MVAANEASGHFMADRGHVAGVCGGFEGISSAMTWGLTCKTCFHCKQNVLGGTEK